MKARQFAQHFLRHGTLKNKDPGICMLYPVVRLELYIVFGRLKAYQVVVH